MSKGRRDIDGGGRTCSAPPKDEVQIITSLDDKLKEQLEALSEKRYTTRETALDELITLLTTNCSIEFVTTNKDALYDGILKGITRGEPKEQLLACRLLSVYAITLGRGRDGLYLSVSPSLREIIRFNADLEVRSQATISLAMTCYVSTTGPTSSLDLLTFFGEFFDQAETSIVFKHIFDSFGLLLTKVPLEEIRDNFFPNYVGKIVPFLRDPSLDVRQAAGELLALLLELQREVDLKENESEELPALEEYEGYFDVSEVLGLLEELRSSNARFTSKKDRSKQRNVFKDIENGVVDGFAPKEKLVFKHQQVVFRSWAEYRMLSAFRDALSIGLHTHFVHNDALQSIFDVTINPDQARVSLQRTEKRLYMSPSSAESKNRSKEKKRLTSAKSLSQSFDNLATSDD